MSPVGELPDGSVNLLIFSVLILFCGLEYRTDADAVAQYEHLGVQLVAHGAAQHGEEGPFALRFGAGHPCRGDRADAQMSARLRVARGRVAVAAASSAQSFGVFEAEREASVGIGDLLAVELDEQPASTDERRAVEFLVFAAGSAGRSCGQQQEQTKRTEAVAGLHTGQRMSFLFSVDKYTQLICYLCIRAPSVFGLRRRKAVSHSRRTRKTLVGAPPLGGFRFRRMRSGGPRSRLRTEVVRRM